MKEILTFREKPRKERLKENNEGPSNPQFRQRIYQNNKLFNSKIIDNILYRELIIE